SENERAERPGEEWALMEAGSLDPNLLATGRRPKGAAADTAPAPAPSSRRKTILKGIAYVAIFFTAFLFFLLLKIPSRIVTNVVRPRQARALPQLPHAGLAPHRRSRREGRIRRRSLQSELERLRFARERYRLRPRRRKHRHHETHAPSRGGRGAQRRDPEARR